MLKRAHFVSGIPSVALLIVLALGCCHQVSLKEVVLHCELMCGSHHRGNVGYRKWASRLAAVQDALVRVDDRTPEGLVVVLFVLVRLFCEPLGLLRWQ